MIWQTDMETEDLGPRKKDGRDPNQVHDIKRHEQEKPREESVPQPDDCSPFNMNPLNPASPLWIGYL